MRARYIADRDGTVVEVSVPIEEQVVEFTGHGPHGPDCQCHVDREVNRLWDVAVVSKEGDKLAMGVYL